MARTKDRNAIRESRKGEEEPRAGEKWLAG